MVKIYSELITIFLLILSGIALRYFRILKKEDASVFLNLVFFITMPALVLANLPSADINYDYLWLPVIPVIVGLITFLVTLYLSRFMDLERKTLGVFVISSLILNTAFIFPFVVLYFKQEGLSRILFFDVGNVFMIFGFGYYQACKFGNHQITNKQLIKRFLTAIPLWAIVLAVVMNYLNLSIKGPLYNFIKITGDLTIPLLLISVGIFFDPRIIKLKVMFAALFLRMGFGMLTGLLLANLFGLEGLTKAVAILGTSTPVGYNTLIFASIENLDKEFAAALVSTSILIALVYVPFMIFFIL
jgi:malate permease and related proteins